MLSLPRHLYRTVARAWAMRPRCLGKLSMTGVLLFGFRLAVAQQQPVPRVYTYVEQMPQLPDGGGHSQIVAAIMSRLRLIGKVEPSCYRALVYFEVDPTGAVQHARIVAASHSAVVDSALLQAVRSLPRLRPGQQHGRPITVSFTMPLRVATQ